VLLVIDALGGTTQWRYDARGLPIERVSAMGGRTTFAYDAHANLERTTLPNGGVFSGRGTRSGGFSRRSTRSARRRATRTRPAATSPRCGTRWAT
jgi:YD repeat-containing protein